MNIHSTTGMFDIW